MKTLILVAGGTAGHVFVANGIAFYGKQKFNTILITDTRGKKYADLSLFHMIYTLSCSNSNSMILKSPLIAYQIWQIFKKYKNIQIVGCGAYLSVLTGILGYLFGYTLHIYQGDQVIGRANHILSYLATTIFVTEKFFQWKYPQQEVGLISRHTILSSPIKIDGKLRILIIGSSIGAQFWIDTIIQACKLLSKKIRENITINQQVSKNKMQFIKSAYQELEISHELFEFVDTKIALQWSNFVIARAGLSTIADLVRAMRPALLIPWPNAHANHQLQNAKWFVKSYGGHYCEEYKFTAQFLANMIQNIFYNQPQLITQSHNLYKWKNTYGGLQIVKILNSD